MEIFRQSTELCHLDPGIRRDERFLSEGSNLNSSHSKGARKA
jgi:hypothetical protein